jgi:23S rRNA (adenine2030-N6)-methyltransferase
MRETHRRFATGIQLVWYPIKDVAAVDAFLKAAAETGVGRLVAIEQWIRDPEEPGPLAGAGVLVANPPWRLAEDTETVLPELTALLADGPDAGARLLRLVGEA